MRRFLTAYPAFALTIGVALVAVVALFTDARSAAPYVVGGYALAIAAWQTIHMVRELLRGHLGLDILAVVAITAAVLVGEPWAAIVVVLMLTGGEALEDYAQHRSKRELDALLKRAPREATRVLSPVSPTKTADSTTLETITIDEVCIGDTLLVRPGEIMPVDSTLITDNAVFDESSLTGESLPVERRSGDPLPSGIVNGSTAITVTAAALAADSEYQQIVNLVDEAQRSRANTVRLADRYAVPFTAFALALAGLAWLVSADPVRFAEVLVVATPCPLLIAAPVAFLGGMSRAAKAGLIVKGGGTLEQLAKVRSIAFDKTGTLTSGHPALTRLAPAPGFTGQQLLQWAATAEVYSSHVLASAVIEAARDHGAPPLPVSDASEHATNGVAARLSGNDSAGQIRVGKPAWVAESAPSLERAEVAAGELAIYVARDGDFVGAIIMRDHLREESAAVIGKLRQLGISRMLMLTGDVPATAAPMAEALGITEVHAECRPQDKVRLVSEVTPRPVMMVGDGLNDAPVLAAAEVGFAMGAKGATAASESADVVNRFDNISGVEAAIRIGRDTLRIALQSIWIGIVMSVVLMLIAAFGLLPALAGAWLQELVDLTTILWALRAISPRFRPRPARALAQQPGAEHPSIEK